MAKWKKTENTQTHTRKKENKQQQKITHTKREHNQETNNFLAIINSIFYSAISTGVFILFIET